ncbi:MAG: hypothetical protein ASARMPREDX12_008271 [Alectoria sarmentosa]|nr:MAG: hypothetical protein ASARMPREDX12_008271 [Alectoria sarmentosa]
MSFLKTIAIRAPRAPLAVTASTKRVRFSTSPYVQKDSTSAVKETVDSVNKTVGEAAVKGIEKGQKATSALKSTVGINAKQAEGSAKEMTGEAKGKGSEMAGEAKGKAQEMAGEAKGKTQEVAGQAKGKAEEVKGKM